MHVTLRRAGATAAAFLAVLLSAPAATAAPSTAPAAAADAYALDVDVTLPLNIVVNQGPFARSSQEYPPQAATFDEAQQFGTGQVPAGGAVVEDISVLESFAQADGSPLARAAALAADVKLINQQGTPLITAEVIQAASTTDCNAAPSSVGTQLVNLQVAGQAPLPDETPDPNTELFPQFFNPLGLRVIANEQHQTADGRGLVVNGLHIYDVSGAAVPGLFTGDIIVAHAMSTVNCPNGAPSTGAGNDIVITKNADKATARPGDTVTYTAVIENNSADEACLVNRVTDHLPVAFEYASTSGALGTVAVTEPRPGGGSDIVIKPADVTIPAGGSVTQTFVVTVKADAAAGTYFNNVELLCGNLGNWVKGLDAPVRIGGPDVIVDPPADKPQCDDGVDNDGDGLIDFPNDPGCTSKLDDSEINEHPRTGGPSHLTLLGTLLILASYGIRRRLAAC